MKKLWLLPALAVAMMVSQANAASCMANGVTQVFCQYDSGCWKLNDSDENQVFVGCDLQASYCPTLYTGASEGSGAGRCASSGGSVFNADGVSWSAATNEIWCDYGGGECWMKSPEECAATQGTNLGSNQSACGANTCDGFCYWPANSESGGSAGCYANAANTANPTCADAITACNTYGGRDGDGSNAYFSTKSACESANGIAPILKVHNNMGLVVATHGRALHISSDRHATVTLYTLAGQKVLSGSVQAGNKVFSLIGQNPGVYYAVVQSGSYTQTLNVILK